MTEESIIYFIRLLFLNINYMLKKEFYYENREYDNFSIIRIY